MSKEKNQAADNDLKKYRDPSGVSLKEMNFGLWLSENRRHLRNVLIAVLVAASAFFFIYSVYGYFMYFIEKPAADNLFADTLNRVTPIPVTENLIIGQLAVFASGAKYDLAVNLKNPNDKFSATLDYCFTSGGQELICGQNFILPGEEKYVLSLGQTLTVAVSDLKFEVKSIAWRRVNVHLIPDWTKFLADHLAINIINLRFASAITSGRSEEVGLNTVQFDAQNKSAYSYYEAPLNILIYNGSDLVGVNRYIISDFQAGETRHVNLTWSGNLNQSDTVTVAPDINVLDDSQFLKYQGGSAAN